MMRQIRKVIDTGNGSARVTIPKDRLRDWGLVDEEDQVDDAHIAFEDDEDGSVHVEPVE